MSGKNCGYPLTPVEIEVVDILEGNTYPKNRDELVIFLCNALGKEPVIIESAIDHLQITGHLSCDEECELQTPSNTLYMLTIDGEAYGPFFGDGGDTLKSLTLHSDGGAVGITPGEYDVPLQSPVFIEYEFRIPKWTYYEEVRFLFWRKFYKVSRPCICIDAVSIDYTDRTVELPISFLLDVSKTAKAFIPIELRIMRYYDEQ